MAASRREPRDDLFKTSTDESWLEAYIRRHVLENHSIYTPCRYNRTIRILLMFIALSFGFAWIDASKNSVSFLPTGLLHDVISYLLVIGTIVTLGVDQIWIMSKIADKLSDKTALTKSLEPQSVDSSRLRAIRIIVPLLCSLASSIPWVYACVRFNHHAFNLITSFAIALPCNLAFGIVGYGTLFNAIINRLQRLREPHRDAIEQARAQILQNISHVRNNNILINDSSPAQLLSSLLKKSDLVTVKYHQIRLISQCLAMCMISPLYAMATCLLSKQLLTQFHVQTIHAYCFAILLTIPGLVISAIATYQVTGRLFDTIMREKTANSIKKFLNPRASRFLFILSLFLATGAPMVEASIAYSVISTEFGSIYLALFSATGMALFHYIFFTFTFNDLCLNAMLHVYQRSRRQLALIGEPSLTKQMIAAQHIRLTILFDAVNEMPAQRLKEVLAS